MNVARYSPNGHYIAGATGLDPLLKLYSFDSETLSLSELTTGNFHIQPINDITWSPCSRYIATGGEDCVIVVWKIHSNERTGKKQLEPRRVLRGHVAAVTTLAFNHMGTMLASGSIDEKIIVWNVKGGTLFKLLNAHSRPIVSVDFSYDNKLLLTASHDGYLRIWSLLDGMALRILSGAEELMPISAAAFSPNSVYALVTHTDGVTRLLNLANKSVEKKYGVAVKLYGEKQQQQDQTQSEIQPHVVQEPKGKASIPLNLYTRELAFSRPNYILVGGADGISVYDIKTQEHIKKLTKTPALCIDVNENLRVGLSAGPEGIKLFRLNFT